MNWRGILLALYILVALVDAGGKILVRDPQMKNAVARAVAHYDAKLVGRITAKPANNLDIFRAASRNLSLGRDLYAEYPTEYGDRFKYSPTFAVLFSPLAVLPWDVSLVFWNLLNALLLFYAIAKVLSRSNANLALAVVLPEVWRNIQSAQSNCIVAALIILAFLAIRRRHVVRAALLITTGTIIKLFPIIAVIFILPSRRRRKFAIALAVCLIGAALLPLIITPPATLAAQYASWATIEMSDAQQRGVSFIEVLGALIPLRVPNLVFQLVGGAILLLPLLRFPNRWRHRDFAIQLLASVLLFAVLFNHQAERPSYIIAFTGIALWYASSPRTRTDTSLFVFAFVMIPIASNFLPVHLVGTSAATLFRLVLPCMLIWVYIQMQLNDLLESREPRARDLTTVPQLSGTRTADL